MQSLIEPNKHRLPVQPVGQSKDRPLWSVLIPTHNCASYLARTLQSVLCQAPNADEMEIIVVDDHSTKDDPEAVVRRLGQGRIKFIRQPHNVGKANNYQTGINASRGQLIHQLHGDDTVGVEFYASMKRCFATHPDAGGFFCETEYINAHDQVTGRSGKELDANGLLENWLEKIYVSQRIQTPSIVLCREVYEQLGGFDQRLSAFEDWEMWVRSAVQFPFGFNSDCTAQYRVYSENTSQQSIINGKRPRIQKQVLQIIDSYVPAEIKRRCKSLRARETAYYLVRCLPVTVKHRRPWAWLRLCGHIAAYSWHPRVWYHAILFTCRNT